MRWLPARRPGGSRTMIPTKSGFESDCCGGSPTMSPVEMYTTERVAEFERETEVDAGTEAAVREALRHPTGA